MMLAPCCAPLGASQALNGLQRVYYPTPRSIEMRVELFKKHGVGISIWELGQGLESFFDLL